MDLYRLKTFKAVAAFLNFNQAARYLNCAQSTVSNQIKSLEDEMGTLFFKRMGKKVQLTTAGEKMIVYANKLLSMEQEAIADITGRKAPQKTIFIRAPEAVIDGYFPTLIKKTLAKYPAAQFDISNCLENNIENELQTETIDLAFIFSDYISSHRLITEKIFTETLIMAALPSHPLAEKATVDAGDLHAETLLFLKTGCGYGLPFRQLLNTSMVKPSSIIEITSVEAIKKCVKKGIGLTILPEKSIQKELQNNELVPLNWAKKLETPVLMVWHRDKKTTGILDYFMQLAMQLRSKDIDSSRVAEKPPKES
jgi:DNA-binding transcriptional LysR family regulator